MNKPTKKEISMSTIVPVVIEKSGRGEKSYDMHSRMLKERIVFLNGDVDDDSAHAIIMQLMYLNASDPEEDITLIINSPGGSVYSGLAIYDMMQAISNDVVTVVSGIAMSMGCFLASGGAKGKRFSLPNSRIMAHQVSSGTRGTIVDMRVDLKETEYLNKRLFEIMSANTGKTLKQIVKDCDRDLFLSPQEAVEYGFLDRVIYNLSDINNGEDE